jgi:hypothetical protein
VNVALWVAAIVLALGFLGSGLTKALLSRDKVVKRMHVMSDLSAPSRSSAL